MEGNSRDSFVMGKISTPEFEHLDFPQMKGPRDFGHADHALKSQVARYRIVGICQELDLKFDSRSHHTDFQIRPTCYPRDRHARCRPFV